MGLAAGTVVAVAGTVGGAVALTAGGGDADAGVEGSPTSRPSGFVESDDCRLAATTWVRAARQNISDSVFEQPFMDADARAEPGDRIEVYCSSDLFSAAAEGDYELAALNAELTICQNVPVNCAPADVTRARDRADALVDRVADLADARG